MTYTKYVGMKLSTTIRLSMSGATEHNYYYNYYYQFRHDYHFEYENNQ